MAIAHNHVRKHRLADKARLLRVADEVNRWMGILVDPTASAEKAQELMLAHGIRPEECEFSREIIRVRNQKYEDLPEIETG